MGKVLAWKRGIYGHGKNGIMVPISRQMLETAGLPAADSLESVNVELHERGLLILSDCVPIKESGLDLSSGSIEVLHDHGKESEKRKLVYGNSSGGKILSLCVRTLKLGGLFGIDDIRLHYPKTGGILILPKDATKATETPKGLPTGKVATIKRALSQEHVIAKLNGKKEYPPLESEKLEENELERLCRLEGEYEDECYETLCFPFEHGDSNGYKCDTPKEMEAHYLGSSYSISHEESARRTIQKKYGLRQ